MDEHTPGPPRHLADIPYSHCILSHHIPSIAGLREHIVREVFLGEVSPNSYNEMIAGFPRLALGNPTQRSPVPFGYAHAVKRHRLRLAESPDWPRDWASLSSAHWNFVNHDDGQTAATVLNNVKRELNRLVGRYSADGRVSLATFAVICGYAPVQMSQRLRVLDEQARHSLELRRVSNKPSTVLAEAALQQVKIFPNASTP